MAPYLSLLPVRKDKRPPPPSSTAAPVLSPPSPAPAPAAPDLDRFFVDSPAPPTRTKDVQRSSGASLAPDMSVLDFTGLGDDASCNLMLIDGGMSFLAEDSFVATPASVEQRKEKSVESEKEPVEELPVLQKSTPAVEPPKPAAPVAISKPPASARPRPSLAPLRAPAPPPPAAVAAPIVAPSPTTKPSQPSQPLKPRPSVARPAHILPKHHPAHPRQSLALPPTTTSSQEPVLPPKPAVVEQMDAPIRSALKQSSSSVSTTLSTSTRDPLPPSVAFPAPSPPPARQTLIAASPSLSIIHDSPASNQSNSYSDGLFVRRASFPEDTSLDGNLSLPAIGAPLDLRGVTSTPARPRAAVSPIVPMPTVDSEDVPAEKQQARRTTMAVTFALPDLEESHESIVEQTTSEVTTAPEETTTAQPTQAPDVPPPTSAAIKRRASRAFDLPTPITTSNHLSASISTNRRASRAFDAVEPPAVVESRTVVGPLDPPPAKSSRLSLSGSTSRRASRVHEGTTLEGGSQHLSTSMSTSRRASRAFASSAPVISSTPGASLLQASHPTRSTPSQGGNSDEAPLSVIRLVPAASLSHSTNSSSQPPAALNAASAAEATTQAKQKAPALGGLTLPRDFGFASRAADREVERKRRTEERERERERAEKEKENAAKRKVSSAWGVVGKAAHEETNKRVKLSSSVPSQPFAASRPTASSQLHSSAPASTVEIPTTTTRQPRSRPSSTFSSSRRRSVAVREDEDTVAFSHSGNTTALTKEALEASVLVVGPKIDLKRRVSRYLEGVLEDDEEGESGVCEEEDEQERAVVEKPWKQAVAPSKRAKEVENVAAAAPAVPATRRPLGTSRAQNQLKSSVPAATPAPLKAKPVTKAQPFTFTARASRTTFPTTSTASPIFTERLSAWKQRELAPGVMPVFSDPVLPKKRKIIPVVPDSEATIFANLEKRRKEREDWEKRQRTREEEVRLLKERQRKEEAEKERLKLKALRDALVVRPNPIPKSTYSARV